MENCGKPRNAVVKNKILVCWGVLLRAGREAVVALMKCIYPESGSAPLMTWDQIQPDIVNQLRELSEDYSPFLNG